MAIPLPDEVLQAVADAVSEETQAAAEIPLLLAAIESVKTDPAAIQKIVDDLRDPNSQLKAALDLTTAPEVQAAVNRVTGK